MKTWQQLPKEIKKKMLKRQFQQKGKKNKNAFKDNIISSNGFVWVLSKEGFDFWHEVINGNFDLFYEKYPKKQMPELCQIGKLFEQFGKDLQGFK
jgi:hypothetical protein